MIHDYGSLAGALSKAQAAFPPIVRDKEVAVRTYSYKYAPLDAILAAVREPLATNGLAIAQLLEGADLVTLLLHESGSTLTARTPLPPWEGVQQYGSMVTYIRRYALTAMLGIATEDDDDGEAAAKPGQAASDKTCHSARDARPRRHGRVRIRGQGRCRHAAARHAHGPRARVPAHREPGRHQGLQGAGARLAGGEDRGRRLVHRGPAGHGLGLVLRGDVREGRPGRSPTASCTCERIETPAGLFVAAKADSLEEHVTRRVTAATPDRDEDDEVTQAMGVARMQAARVEPCTNVDTGPMGLGICQLALGHKGPHKNTQGSWPL